jgi:hypothetical protein
VASLKAPDIRVCVGRGGSGKTTLVNHWLDKHKGRILIFDPNGEDGYAGRGVAITDPRHLLLALKSNKIRVIRWQGVISMAKAAFEFANQAAWAAQESARSDLMLVWEEADSFMEPGKLPQWAFALVNQGRHRRIRLVACARRPARFSRDLTANASRISVFRTTEPRDLKYLSDYVGQENADLLPRLQDYHALDWTDKKSKVKKSPFA